MPELPSNDLRDVREHRSKPVIGELVKDQRLSKVSEYLSQLESKRSK